MLKHILIIGILFLSLNLYSQTESYPQLSRYLNYSVWYSEDKPTTSGMVMISGGKYAIGVDDIDLDVYKKEVGQSNGNLQLSDIKNKKRTVRINSFYILKHEVTNKQYLEFLDYTCYSPPPMMDNYTEGLWGVMEIFAWHGRIYPQGRAGFPVTGITPVEAELFCKWRTETTGILHRLPTAEEFQTAYQGKLSEIFPWGNEWKKRMNVCVDRHSEVGPDPFYYENDDVTENGISNLFGGVSEFVYATDNSENAKMEKSKNPRDTKDSLYQETFYNDKSQNKEFISLGLGYDDSPDQFHPLSMKIKMLNTYKSYKTGFRYVIPLDKNNKPIKAKK